MLCLEGICSRLQSGIELMSTDKLEAEGSKAKVLIMINSRCSYTSASNTLFMHKVQHKSRSMRRTTEKYHTLILTPGYALKKAYMMILAHKAHAKLIGAYASKQSFLQRPYYSFLTVACSCFVLNKLLLK